MRCCPGRGQGLIENVYHVHVAQDVVCNTCVAAHVLHTTKFTLISIYYNGYSKNYQGSVIWIARQEVLSSSALNKINLI